MNAPPIRRNRYANAGPQPQAEQATTERMGVDPLAYGVVEREGGPIVALRYDEEGAVEWMANARSEYRNQQCPSPSYRLIKLVDRAAVAELVAADMLLDKCDAALEQHRAAETHPEAWAATQLELWRSRDLAAKRRAAALAPFSEAQS